MGAVHSGGDIELGARAFSRGRVQTIAGLDGLSLPYHLRNLGPAADRDRSVTGCRSTAVFMGYVGLVMLGLLCMWLLAALSTHRTCSVLLGGNDFASGFSTNMVHCLPHLCRYTSSVAVGSHLGMALHNTTGQANATQYVDSAAEEACVLWQLLHTWSRHARAQNWRHTHHLCHSSGMATVEVDPYGRPPLPRRRPLQRADPYREPLPRRRAVRLRPAVRAGPFEEASLELPGGQSQPGGG